MEKKSLLIILKQFKNGHISTKEAIQLIKDICKPSITQYSSRSVPEYTYQFDSCTPPSYGSLC